MADHGSDRHRAPSSHSARRGRSGRSHHVGRKRSNEAAGGGNVHSPRRENSAGRRESGDGARRLFSAGSGVLAVHPDPAAIDLEWEWEHRHEHENVDQSRELRQSLTSVINDPKAIAKASGGYTRPVFSSSGGVSTRSLDTFFESIAEPMRMFEEYQNLSLDVGADATMPVEAEEVEGERNALQLYHEKLNKLMETVPPVFFDDTFSLQDPETFRVACEDAIIAPLLGVEKRFPPNLHMRGGPRWFKAYHMQLTSALDLVEAELVEQISGRSRAFFTALSRLRFLHKDISDACQSIRLVRQQLARMEKETRGSLEVVSLKRRGYNMKLVFLKLKVVKTVRDAPSAVQLLLSNSNYLSPLAVIQSARVALAEELEGMVCFRYMGSQLSELRSMIIRVMHEEVLSRVRTMVQRIEDEGVGMGPLLAVSVAGEGMNVDKSGRSNGPENILFDESNAATGGVLSDLGLFSTSIRTLLTGLLYTGNLPEALPKYQDAMQQSVKILVQQVVGRLLSHVVEGDAADGSTRAVQRENADTTLGSIASPSVPKRTEEGGDEMADTGQRAEGEEEIAVDKGEGSTRVDVKALTGKLRVAQLNEFNALLWRVCRCLLQALDIATAVHEEVARVTNELRGRITASRAHEVHGVGSNGHAGGSYATMEESIDHPLACLKWHSSLSASACEDIASDSMRVLLSIHDFALNRLCRMFKIRAEIHARLALPDFQTLMILSNSFISCLERRYQHAAQPMPFRSVLLTQGQQFLQSFHKKRTTTMALILESEKWARAEVAREFQEIANRINADYGEVNGMIYQPVQLLRPRWCDTPEMLRIADASVDSPSTEQNENSKTLMLGDEKFHVVNAVLMLLKNVDEYMECVDRLPALHLDVLKCIVELLQLFNSRTCGLVLGMGAMHVAALKSISAKHLAFAAQSVLLVLRIIPHVKNSLAQHCSKQSLVLLDDLDRVTHDYEVHHEELMTKFSIIMKDRVDLHCSKLSTMNWKKDQPTASLYVQEIVKETATLYRILMQLLPARDLESAFGQVFAMFNARLVEHFSLLRLNATGKKRLWIDIQYLLSALKAFDGLEAHGNSLDILAHFYRSHFGDPPAL